MSSVISSISFDIDRTQFDRELSKIQSEREEFRKRMGNEKNLNNISKDKTLALRDILSRETNSKNIKKFIEIINKTQAIRDNSHSSPTTVEEVIEKLDNLTISVDNTESSENKSDTYYFIAVAKKLTSKDNYSKRKGLIYTCNVSVEEKKQSLKATIEMRNPPQEYFLVENKYIDKLQKSVTGKKGKEKDREALEKYLKEAILCELPNYNTNCLITVHKDKRSKKDYHFVVYSQIKEKNEPAKQLYSIKVQYCNNYSKITYETNKE